MAGIPFVSEFFEWGEKSLQSIYSVIFSPMNAYREHTVGQALRIWQMNKVDQAPALI